MKKELIIWTILTLTLVTLILGCAKQTVEEKPEEQSQIANPASVYCEKQGGKLEIRTAADGSQSGYCTLKDGTECEEWAYYKGECPVKEAVERVNCVDFDGKKEECLSYEGCKWMPEDNVCEPANKESSDYEDVDVPDTISNEICKKLPLSTELSPDDGHYCFAVVNHNAEFCKEIDEEDQANLCLAHANKDFSFCKKMSDISGKKTCYFVLSQTSGNINFCDGIDYDKNERELCYFSFANALYWEDKSDRITTEHCNKLPAGEGDRNTCIALKERDVSICKDNKNCLTFFKQDLSFCNDNFKEKNECIRDRALSSKDISVCDQISDKISKEDCYGDYASHISHAIPTCDKISNPMKKQGCYVDVAINLAK